MTIIAGQSSEPKAELRLGRSDQPQIRQAEIPDERRNPKFPESRCSFARISGLTTSVAMVPLSRLWLVAEGKSKRIITRRIGDSKAPKSNSTDVLQHSSC
jgi:hypothetical protein